MLAAALAVLALVAVAVMAVAVTRTGGAAPASLERQVDEFTARLARDGPYRPPGREERDDVVAAVVATLGSGGADDDARGALERAGLEVSTVTADGGARYVLLRADPGTERSWGLIALPLDAPPRLLVEVPHPNSDLGTEKVGIALLRAVPDAVYLQAGAHRRAAGEEADVAHRTDSLFHALAVDLSERMRLPQVQLHGFADRDDLDAEVVLSSGTDDPDPAVRDVGDRLDDGGVEICRAWSTRCRGLEGTTNVQARAAAGAGLPFAHVEIGAEARSRSGRTEKIVAALAAMAGPR